MSDELKSAVELALEKLEAGSEETVEKLTAEQKEEIADIRRKYRARIAEVEISSQSKMKKAAMQGDRSGIDEIPSQAAEEKNRLQRKMEEEVERVRKKG